MSTFDADLVGHNVAVRAHEHVALLLRNALILQVCCVGMRGGSWCIMHMHTHLPARADLTLIIPVLGFGFSTVLLPDHLLHSLGLLTVALALARAVGARGTKAAVDHLWVCEYVGVWVCGCVCVCVRARNLHLSRETFCSGAHPSTRSLGGKRTSLF